MWILGGSDLPSLLEVFSWIQCATGSQLSSKHDGDCTTFIAACGNTGSSQGGHGGRGGRSNHSMDYCWDLHGKQSGFVNQVFS